MALPLEEMGTFVRAAEQGSLSAAARSLGVPKSTVSRRIARLEAALGVELVRRTSRTFRLTEAGEALLRRAGPAVRDLEEAARGAGDLSGEPSGELRLTAPVDVGTSEPFVRFLVQFAARHPGIQVNLDTSDRFVDLDAEGFDVAVRMHSGPLDDRSGLKVRRLGQVEAGVYASPEYLAAHGTPAHPRELVAHRAVSVDRTPIRDAWPLLGPGDAAPTWYPVRPAFLGHSLGFLPAALASGAGVGFLFHLLAADLLAAGRVVRVLPEWRGPAATVSVLWPATRHVSPRVRALLDAFEEGPFVCGA